MSRGLRRRDLLLAAGAALATPGHSAAELATRSDGGRAGDPLSTPVEVLEALWKALTENYPMMELAGAYGDEWREEFRPRVAAAPDLAAAYPVLEELVCRLRDYHTRLVWPGKPDLASFPVLGHELRRGSRSGVLARASATPQVTPGEEILALDGRAIADLLADARRYAVGSTPEALSRSAVSRALSAPRGSTVTFTFRRQPGEPAREVRLPATGFPTEPALSHHSLDPKTGYLRIAHWEAGPGADLAAMIDAALEAYRTIPALVIDVRGNGGGSDELAERAIGRFLQRPVVASISFFRQVPTQMFQRSVEFCQPRGPWRYPGRVVVLADEGCASACEHFVSGMLEAGACLVGMPTSGACGLIRAIPLPGGATLYCSRSFPLHGATPSPRHGLEPHFRVRLARRDLERGDDAALARAVAWLHSEEPLPVRREPVL